MRIRLQCTLCKHIAPHHFTGYTGRIAIQELFVPNEEIKEMINDRSTLKKLRKKGLQNGMISLHSDGIEKVKAGIISIEEVLRTTQAEL